MLAYTTGNQQVLLVALLLVSLLVAASVLVRVRRLRLAATRSVEPAVVAAGTTARVTLVVRNLSTVRAAAASWSDSLPWPPHTSPPGRLPALARARASTGNAATVAYELTPPARGVVEIGPLRIDYADPFRLVRGTSSVAGREDLVVAPRVYQLESGALSSASGDGSVVAIQRSTTGNEDDLMTREYRRGDALRRVHWRASARHGELMVRQEEQRSLPVARVFIDTQRAGYPDAAGGRATATTSDSFEWVVSMVASLGVHLVDSGYGLQVVESGARQLEPVTSTVGLLAGLAGIALCEPRGATEAGESGGGPMFAIVASPTDDTIEWMLRQRKPYDRAAALLVDSSAHVVERFALAGWQYQVVDPNDDPATAWRRLLAQGAEARTRGSS